MTRSWLPNTGVDGLNGLNRLVRPLPRPRCAVVLSGAATTVIRNDETTVGASLMRRDEMTEAGPTAWRRRLRDLGAVAGQRWGVA